MSFPQVKAVLLNHRLRLPLAACRFAFALAFSFSGAPYRSGKADRYNPQGGAHGCATFL
ncbi:hypothetical protein [Xanthomonas campestris]|uniref:hypothetical protein n=1 Tax=Xanthomonas campestris TaxID=339 RepID=UPI0023682B91|nr:hypothetical protein [Xanthomonas campestris]WDK89472.1 hypothetical protein JH305_10255 [Xanthomonas campestris pv. campestris]